jgi:tripartite-type tricarboxylate transporter receptor subunit TctC
MARVPKDVPMKIPRRRFLHLAAAAAMLPAAPSIVRAQAYPTRPVRIIVGQAAGSSSDIVARLLGQWLSERLGQPFVIEDRPGAGGNIATEGVVRAPPDGYMLLLANSQHSINTTLYDRLNFNFIRDIAPVAGIFLVPLVMEVNPAVPATTVPEFIAYAKANPGKINMASAGNGGPQHVAGELFKYLAGVDMLHVPYRGSTPALTDLIAGQVQVMFDVVPSSIQHIRSGALRALAVTTTTRADVLPDIPPLAEFVPGYEASAWLGLGAPRDTPGEIVARLNAEINAALADPRTKSRLADLGGTTLLKGSPAEFGKLVAVDTEKWAKVVKFSGAKPD